MRIRVVDCASENFREALRDRSPRPDPELEKVVARTIEDVRTRGDEALLEQARRFDSPAVESVEFKFSSIGTLPILKPTFDAISEAHRRISVFHDRQMEILTSGWEKLDRGWAWRLKDARIGQRMAPIRTAGIYVPGGGAAYPSSVLMLAGPARSAGVGRIVCSSPAMPNGKPNGAVVAALGLCGVDGIFMIGGAGAIAAMAFGTQTVPKVDKIAGPGNRFVNEAKRQLWGTVGLDGYAGPSEVCVLADDEANARFAAIDLLTQVEHAPDNAGFLVCLSAGKLDEILSEADRLLESAERAPIMSRALADNGIAFLASDMDQALEIVNTIAPEHLSLSVADPESVFDKVECAGCVLMGEWTPESAADYCLGPSHTLPTSGAARFANPVNVLDFLKIQSFAHLGKEELEPLRSTIEEFGKIERLPMHGMGATGR
jgi:histidinol dehydrogenase